ncbi:MAG: hypothetical protein C3F07_09375 [Anaerolineales bacterium]|nr:hypothetical protein [Anaerolineae bacterium]PWB73549.1 MAG: hypothetical protein C3F07_09375 [Anaerolineales bacterium]
MNNLYTWHDERMVSLKMNELDRELVSIRLLHDAGLANPGAFERTIIALANGLVRLGNRLYKSYTDPQQAYQTTSGKFAA